MERQNLAATLSAHGVRPTQQRIAVFDYLLTHHTHPSADTIYNALSREYPVFSRTSPCARALPRRPSPARSTSSRANAKRSILPFLLLPFRPANHISPRLSRFSLDFPVLSGGKRLCSQLIVFQLFV